MWVTEETLAKTLIDAVISLVACLWPSVLYPIEGTVKPDKSSGCKPRVCGRDVSRLASEDDDYVIFPVTRSLWMLFTVVYVLWFVGVICRFTVARCGWIIWCFPMWVLSVLWFVGVGCRFTAARYGWIIFVFVLCSVLSVLWFVGVSCRSTVARCEWIICSCPVFSVLLVLWFVGVGCRFTFTRCGWIIWFYPI